MKGKQALKDALQRGLLSEHDIAYIKVATDPWHDTSIDSFVGVPDEYIGKSVTEVLTLTYDIKTPYTAGSGNFNVRINNNPFLGEINLVKSTSYGPTYTNEVPSVAPVNTVTLGTIDLQYSLTSNFSDYPSSTSRVTLSLPQEVLEGNVKIAGCGIEVVNTTSDLYKQGLVSMARVPQPASSTFLTSKVYGAGGGGTAGSFHIIDAIPVISMPTTPTELTTYPDYKQWEAREGLYSVVRQYDFLACAPLGWRGVTRFIDVEAGGNTAATSYGQKQADIDALNWVAAGTAGTPVGTYIQNKGVIPWPCDSCVSMFLGLSEQTTMSLKAKFYVERRVNTSITALRALVPFVKDSPPINPLVLELVSKLWAELPPAVMFKENPAGEWWDRVISTVGEIAPQVLGMIPHPLAQAAATGIKMIAGNGQPKPNREKQLEQAAEHWKEAAQGAVSRHEYEQLLETLRNKHLIDARRAPRAITSAPKKPVSVRQTAAKSPPPKRGGKS